ncbi:HK97 family phage prohead protease, partial [Vibrio sp. ER1A]|uniref:HK97 family phage prohead protease n=1 Tax=Vibrio sp. ER1A TaxID=1517681 RepID=UPI001268A146
SRVNSYVDGCYKFNSKRMPKMLLQHDYKQVCGIWLDIKEDEKGLRVKGQLALNTAIGRETYELLKMGALDSLSIGYVVNKEKYDAEKRVNYLEEIDIKEISIVTFACNDASFIDSVKGEEIVPETDINTPEAVIEIEESSEEPEQEVVSTEEVIPTETLLKLEELVLAIKLSNISF